ncbi:MAG TPA: LysM peptidoglycan-binding domain-containing protein [Anaerolineae bacterium]
MPWADLILFTVIGGLLALWWTNPLSNAAPRPVAMAATGTITPNVAAFLLPMATDTAVARPVQASATPTPPPPTATKVPTPIQHKVAAGESVGLIADKYDVKVKDLLAVNNMKDDLIFPGQMLTIPGSAAPLPPTPTPTPTGGTLIYRVQSGDTISDLAEKYGSHIDWIMQVNKMKDGDVLSIGQSIMIPLSADTPTPTPTGTPTPPAATFTPGAPRPTPALLTPGEGSTVSSGDQVLLSWTSVGILADDEWYVVTVSAGKGGDLLTPYWTKDTSWRLPLDYRPASALAVPFTWQVQIVRGRPGQADPKPVPVGPASIPHHFNW